MAAIQMPNTYAWDGLDAKKRNVSGEIQGQGEAHVAILLKQQGA